MSTISHLDVKNENKLVSNKDYVEINGVKHGLISETVDDSLPVLLVVHGGPGFPLYPIAKAKKVEFHKHFTVCYYDQRGTGMSYVSDDSLSIEQVVSDTVEISKYLINKFKVEKLYLLGHSWGTIVGSLAAKVQPHLFHAYIGIGQVGEPLESERETYNYVLEKAKEVGNKKWIAEIESYPFNDGYYKDQKYNSIRSKYTEKFGTGFLRNGYSNFDSLKDILRTPHYTLKERFNILRGAFNSYQAFGETMAKSNLMESITYIDTPIYILQGKHDHLTSHNQALTFYNHIDASHKTFVTFEDSSHCPFIDEQERFLQELGKILLEVEGTRLEAEL